jgi:hypothetical protein
VISGANTRHLLTLDSAMLARIGTALAVFDLMLPAFLFAFAANVGTNAADIFRELRAGGHHCGRGEADLRAITIQGDAARHHFDIVLLQAGAGAVFAFARAVIAGFDAALKLFVHKIPFVPDSASGHRAMFACGVWAGYSMADPPL